MPCENTNAIKKIQHFKITQSQLYIHMIQTTVGSKVPERLVNLTWFWGCTHVALCFTLWLYPPSPKARQPYEIT